MRDKYEQTRQGCINVKWLKRHSGLAQKVYTCVCDCGKVVELMQVAFGNGKRRQRDCGCGIAAKTIAAHSNQAA